MDSTRQPRKTPRTPIPGANGGLIPPCNATTRKGTLCNFPARRGRRYCINHDPEYIQQQQENVRKGARNSARSRASALNLRFDDLDLTDRASIQALLEAAITLELAGKLPQHRARNLIRLLSLATRNLRNSEHGWVRSIDAPHTQRYNFARHTLTHHLHSLLQDTPDDPE